MTHLSPAQVYEDLQLLERVDVVRSASYRQAALEILADLTVSLDWRQAIADRLNQANHLLSWRTVDTEDSY